MRQGQLLKCKLSTSSGGGGGGKEGQACFPPYMNHATLTWPAGAVEYGKMTRQYDRDFLASSFEHLRIGAKAWQEARRDAKRRKKKVHQCFSCLSASIPSKWSKQLPFHNRAMPYIHTERSIRTQAWDTESLGGRIVIVIVTSGCVCILCYN